jgi:hypothetical protein
MEESVNSFQKTNNNVAVKSCKIPIFFFVSVKNCSIFFEATDEKYVKK